jgi:hypothetical protein
LRVDAGFLAANEFDSKSTSFVLASIKITDGFLRSGSLAKFEKTVVARAGSKAVDGVPKRTPQNNAEIVTPINLFISY